MVGDHFGRLNLFLIQFQSFFIIRNSKAFEVFETYVHGIIVSCKKNCEKISQRVKSNHQTLNHFISNSPWNWEAIPDKIALLFVKALPVPWQVDLCLAIDESSNPKKGNKSSGVAHQYCGQLGKNANCQTGVYSALICRGFYCVIRAILYLNTNWCATTGSKIPLIRKNPTTKIQLAYELIQHALREKIPFKWINFDSFYGRDQQFLGRLDQEGLCFIADVPQDATVYTKLPKCYIPQSVNRGRKPTKFKIDGMPYTVSKIGGTIPKTGFRKITLRKTINNRKLEAEFASKEVYVVSKSLGHLFKATLLIRKDIDGKIYYALCNRTNIALKRLSYMHCQRYFIERSFQELKQEFGLNQYQIRGYEGWHKHAVICMIAQLFSQCEKLHCLKYELIITTPKIIELLKLCIPTILRTNQSIWYDVLVYMGANTS